MLRKLHLRDALAFLSDIARSKAVVRAALLILPYAGILIGLDVAAHYGSLTDAPLPVQFYLASDRGFGEYLEYSLTLAIACMTFMLWLRERAMVYLANTALFVWLTLDNALEFHEAFGAVLAPMLAGIGALAVEPAHLLEAFLMTAIGGFWLLALALALRNAKADAIMFTIALGACVIGAALFGIVVDLVVVWGERGAALHAFITFVEDAGEFAMIIVGFLVTVGFFDQQSRRRAGE